MKKEGMLYEKLSDSAVRCHICQWNCRINPGRLGVCRTRLNEEGTLYTLIYGEATSVAIDPIEKKPLFHFYPGSKVLSLGTWGCNFHCRHCQNWQISYARYEDGAWMVQGMEQEQGHTLLPVQSVALAKASGCAGIAWTYNEPTIWFEQTLETARLAKEAGLYTVYVTNGYISPEALDVIGPYLDAYRVDIKGFTKDLYRRLSKVPGLEGILGVAQRAKEKWAMHVEVVTNIVPGWNDSPQELRATAQWVRDYLGRETPWHVTRFFPYAELSHLPPTPLPTLVQAREIGLVEGLHFVYIGNAAVAGAEDTRCPGCGRLVIARRGYGTNVLAVSDTGRCLSCGADLNLRGSYARNRLTPTPA